MGPIDIIIIVLAVAAVVAVVAHSIWKKKNGKSGCGCGCSGCPSAGACPSAKKEKAGEQTEHEETINADDAKEEAENA